MAARLDPRLQGAFYLPAGRASFLWPLGETGHWRRIFLSDLICSLRVSLVLKSSSLSFTIGETLRASSPSREMATWHDRRDVACLEPIVAWRDRRDSVRLKPIVAWRGRRDIACLKPISIWHDRRDVECLKPIVCAVINALLPTLAWCKGVTEPY